MTTPYAPEDVTLVLAHVPPCQCRHMIDGTWAMVMFADVSPSNITLIDRRCVSGYLVEDRP